MPFHFGDGPIGRRGNVAQIVATYRADEKIAWVRSRSAGRAHRKLFAVWRDQQTAKRLRWTTYQPDCAVVDGDTVYSIVILLHARLVGCDHQNLRGILPLKLIDPIARFPNAAGHS